MPGIPALRIQICQVREQKILETADLGSLIWWASLLCGKPVISAFSTKNLLRGGIPGRISPPPADLRVLSRAPQWARGNFVGSFLRFFGWPRAAEKSSKKAVDGKEDWVLYPAPHRRRAGRQGWDGGGQRLAERP
jgi:hypothetical protein